VRLTQDCSGVNRVQNHGSELVNGPPFGDSLILQAVAAVLAGECVDFIHAAFLLLADEVKLFVVLLGFCLRLFSRLLLFEGNALPIFFC
jgi:hypothetical protein